VSKAKNAKWVHQPELWELHTELLRYVVWHSGKDPKKPWTAKAVPTDLTKARIERLGTFSSKMEAMRACRAHQKIKNGRASVRQFLQGEPLCEPFWVP
jgi:hypothetical protein